MSSLVEKAKMRERLSASPFIALFSRLSLWLTCQQPNVYNMQACKALVTCKKGVNLHCVMPNNNNSTHLQSSKREKQEWVLLI